MATTHTAAKAYPLQWPKGRSRETVRKQSKFTKKTMPNSLAALKKELKSFAAEYIVVSTNVPIKANGDPYSDPGRIPDPGVAVYFRLKGRTYALSCDRWVTVEENLYAVAKHIEAMRSMDRYGVGSVEQAFAGFKELPENAGDEDPWDVLGLQPMASADAVIYQHRQKAMKAHPDAGGSEAEMTRLNVARDKALAALKAEAR